MLICKLQRILKGFTSLAAQRVFTSMMRIMQHANRGLACRISCCRSQSGLFSASAVNVREAHEYMHAIQPCNTDLCCIVVTSWHHCVLHHKLAIKINTSSKWITFLFDDLSTVTTVGTFFSSVSRASSTPALMSYLINSSVFVVFTTLITPTRVIIEN